MTLIYYESFHYKTKLRLAITEFPNHGIFADGGLSAPYTRKKKFLITEALFTNWLLSLGVWRALQLFCDQSLNLR